MLIEVVNPGETLSAIAKRYGVTVDRLVELNAISDPSRLAVGQALLVPSAERHMVERGQTLWSIARIYGVTEQALASFNNISDSSRLQPGQVLRIPPRSFKPTIESNAYLLPGGTARDRSKVNEAAEALTYLSIFSYKAKADGSLEAPPDGEALAALRPTTAEPMMTVTNFAEGTFSPDLTNAILNNETVRNRLINNILEVMREKRFFSLNVDFEHIAPKDREAYNNFLRQLTARVHERGAMVSTALAPKMSATQVGEWYEAHDYAAHGRIVDFVVIMTYEWGWSGGPPMAVAPLPQVRRVLDYALSVIPRNKIIMGAPLYGYDWTLPYVKGGKFARSLGLNEAVEQAIRVGAAIQYDWTAHAPHYSYYEGGKEHVVWFEDVRSLQAKFNLIKELGLRGISYWVLGKPFPQNWTLLQDNFNIRKYKS